MERPKRRSLWEFLRCMIGARLDLPMGGIRGAINELEPQDWQQVQYDERSAEQQQHRDP